MTDLIEARARPAGPAGAWRPGASSTESPPAEIAEPAGPRARWRPLLRPASYYIASRLAMLAVASIVAAFHSTVRIPRTLGSIFDGRWYVLIAQHGYPHKLVNEGVGSRWAFFPAFPAAVRTIAEVTRLSLPDAAALAGFVFGLTSALAIFLAVREVAGASLADRTVLLYVCFPTAYVLSLGYTEGLFLTAAAGCLYALAQRAWVGAGLCACLAGATRNAGIVVIAIVLVTAIPAAWRTRTWRPALGALIAPVGLAAFMVYGWRTVGTPVAFVTTEHFWHGQHFVWFRTPVRALLTTLRYGPTTPTFVANALGGAAVVLGFVGLWWLDRLSRAQRVRIPASWWIYTVGTLLVAYSAAVPDSIARYAMVAFPIFTACAHRLGRWTLPVAGVLLCAQAALLVMILSNTWHPGLPLIP